MIVHFNLYLLPQERPEHPSQLKKPGCQPNSNLRPIKPSLAALKTALRMLDHDRLSYDPFHNNWIFDQAIQQENNERES